VCYVFYCKVKLRRRWTAHLPVIGVRARWWYNVLPVPIATKCVTPLHRQTYGYFCIFNNAFLLHVVPNYTAW